MPSPDSPRRLRTRDELLDHAFQRGDHLRRRRQVLLGAGSAAAVLLVVVASVAFIGGDPERVTNVANQPIDRTTTTTETRFGEDGDLEPTTTTVADFPSSPGRIGTTSTTSKVSAPSAPVDRPTPCQPATPKAPTNRGRILFVRQLPDGSSDIWSMNADGTDQKRLTFHAGQERYPAWDPTGTRFVYQASSGLRIMDADGSNDRALGPDGTSAEFDMSWSADGSKIAFEDGLDLWTIDADGANRRRIVDAPEGKAASLPSWSPDGCWLLYSDLIGGVYKVRPDGSGVTRLPIEGVGKWGPDGRIAVAKGGDVGFYDADGRRTGEIHAGRGIGRLAWSPDGTRFAFQSDGDGGGSDIYTMRVSDGGDIRRLTTATDAENEPAW